MALYLRHRAVDLGSFAPSVNDPQTRYGLPQEVRYCNSCVISNQRPNSDIEFRHTAASSKQTIHFDEAGVCDACRVAERKQTEIDWEARERGLIELCDRYRSRSGRYDCLVPGSGGKDSAYAAHLLKYKYGMHPLTVTWSPHMHTDWGWKNFQSWIHAGFDNYLHTPNGRSHRLLTRLAVENLFHPFQPFMLGQKGLAPKMAVRFEIPLIFYGENEAEYGNPIADTGTPLRHAQFFAAAPDDELFLGGVSITDLKQVFGLSEQDLSPYRPVDPQQVTAAGIEVHYLGYYLRWHPQSCYYYAVENCGFQASPERTPGTYSKYNSIDDKIDDIHYYCTYVKFGIGRATYDASQEVRSGDITREEAIALIRRFDGEFPTRFAEDIYRYLSLPEDEFPVAHRQFESPIMDHGYFMHLADRFRSPHLWVHENGEWRLRHRIVTHAA